MENICTLHRNYKNVNLASIIVTWDIKTVFVCAKFILNHAIFKNINIWRSSLIVIIFMTLLKYFFECAMEPYKMTFELSILNNLQCDGSKHNRIHFFPNSLIIISCPSCLD